MANPNATPREQQMLDAIREFHATFGYMPTLRDLVPRMGLCMSMCRYLLVRLGEKGYVRRSLGRQARAFTLVEDRQEA